MYVACSFHASIAQIAELVFRSAVTTSGPNREVFYSKHIPVVNKRQTDQLKSFILVYSAVHKADLNWSAYL